MVAAALQPDLALVRVDLATPRDPITIATRARPNREVVAVGCPAGLRPWYVTGQVVGTGYELFPEGTWGINTPITGGYSGGPVIELATGKLVGVVSGGLQMQVGPFVAVPVPGVAAMVPCDEVIRWLRETAAIAERARLPTSPGNGH